MQLQSYSESLMPADPYQLVISFPFPSLIVKSSISLVGTAIDDGGLDFRADLSTARAKCLEFGNNFHALSIGNLTEDDMLAIEPRSDDGGDEELRAVAVRTVLAES
jgi:hypothetical protein